MQTLQKVAVLAGLALLCQEARAAILSLELSQDLTSYNYQSRRGVPISSTVNTNLGSDGRMPMINESYNSYNVPTTNQHLFRGFMSFGAVPGLTSNEWRAVSDAVTLQSGETEFCGDLAVLMKRPVARNANGRVVMVVRRAQVGAPYFSRPVSFPFGSVVSVPTTDERGLQLTNTAPQNYWLPEPYGHTAATAYYYWSPNARQVFATEPGPITITWRKAQAYSASALPTYANPGGGPSFETNGLSVYLLYTAKYIVSSSPVKPPRKMYWTEKDFSALGKPISVPAARVGDIGFAYNNAFPRYVAEEYKPPNYDPNQLSVTNTLWYDSGQNCLKAYNVEGRIFIELLGDSHPDGLTREFLDFEIVDVVKQPDPADVPIELGERLTPPPPGTADELVPQPIPLRGDSPAFAYQHNLAGSDKIELFAAYETSNLNDYLVHWMEEGGQGLLWPRHLARYVLYWPDDISKYSLYLRPEAATDQEAQETAVALPTEMVPSIVCQDQDPLEGPRAKLTADFKFYTWLTTNYPAQRVLLQYTAGDNVAFERVFSFLDRSLKSPSQFAGSVAEHLRAWDSTNLVFHWPDELASPRIEQFTWNVGERITAPAGEPGWVDTYLAGHINQSVGTSFDASAYQDPFAAGFEAANQGAIIPVNAKPEHNLLEVWWFRPCNSQAGPNVANEVLGFKTSYWPSVIGRYTLRWPASSREIVLASNRGSGTLDTFQAQGQIYVQNDPYNLGYNPNEEHALMSGGMAYALRDDLNITNGVDYSSDPFVLVRYLAQDGRPAMTPFKVLREKPEAGYVFDYISPAGRMLQAPMPLPLLQKPVEGSGDSAINYNKEPSHSGGDVPKSWTERIEEDPEWAPPNSVKHYAQFTYSDRHNDFWVYRGLHAGLPVLQAGKYDTNTSRFETLPSATAVVGQSFRYFVHASRQSENLGLTVPAGLPAWLHIDNLSLQGTPSGTNVGTVTLQVVVEDLYDHTRVTNSLAVAVVASGAVVTQGPLVICCSNQYTGTITWYSNRPPFLAASPAVSNSFTMRFYYRTLPGFAWPGPSTPPEPGSIVPYLRPYAKDPPGFVGIGTSKETASLEIVYRPVWPESDPKDSSKPLPTLPYGASLAKPGFGLPGVRDMKTAYILYQQSVASNFADSAVLHDPTRAKYSDLQHYHMDQLPSSVQTDMYQGRYYFPGLPPHLANRLYFDPNRGTNGALVLRGVFKNEVAGESYLLLNVMRGSGLAAALALCSTNDPAKTAWDKAINGLTTKVETFGENPAQPGTYIPAGFTDIGVQALAEVRSENTAVDSYALSATGPGSGYVTLLESSGTAFTEPGDPVSMHIFRVGGGLHLGEVKVLADDNPLSEMVTFQHTPDMAGRFDEYWYEWRIAAPVDGMPPATDTNMSNYLPLASGTDMSKYTLGGAGIQTLCDNYIVMRYCPSNSLHPLYGKWSEWTTPKLAEGWIKRVLAGINPFNQRTTDLFNNRVNTDVSMLTQAGRRWEGDVALNADTLNNYGLIEIYETVLRRGRMLSIEPGINYGPANDSLLLAAGYLNDLYMMEGNEAWADAVNPTIGIGTKESTYGDIATALFSFKGQVPSLLEENLALLRGRDDFMMPGVETQPVYNRLVWNYTQGISSGEAIYALNYDIQENPDKSPDGTIDATDAAYLYPQGHGDAYGHYLTALKGYYSLLLNSYFDWVPRIEAIDVLGMPVAIDYQDERKFASAAAALARAGQQVFDLTWRRDYQRVHTVAWRHFATTRVNTQRAVPTTRYWGMDHWASRVGQGAFVNWVAANALLPDLDPNPLHEGIQKIDRTTVPELEELALIAQSLQTDMDNAEGGLTPVGLPEGGLAFDLNPNAVAGSESATHFEQIYGRALVALNNAVAAFDDAKDVTRLMRSEEDSLNDFQAGVNQQETAFNNALIELYGTPYTDDLGAGKTYKQDYSGPDYIHYMYVELPEAEFPSLWNYPTQRVFRVDLQDLPTDWVSKHREDLSWYHVSTEADFETNAHLTFNVGTHGFYGKPEEWAGTRASPGKIQQAISQYITAHEALRQALWDSDGGKVDLDKEIEMFNSEVRTHDDIRAQKLALLIAQQVLNSAKFANEMVIDKMQMSQEIADAGRQSLMEALPKSLMIGLAYGGDSTFFARGALQTAFEAKYSLSKYAEHLVKFGIKLAEFSNETARQWTEFSGIAPLEWEEQLKARVKGIGDHLSKLQGNLWTINERLRALDNADRNYRALLAQGDRIQAQRETFRKRAAAVIQGYRTRDAAFRLFRDEKLERYQSLFGLAARYSLLAANAYDYETGLLNTSAGRTFINRIINSQALGIVSGGRPQYAGSDTGDPGLSSTLAEMKADWDVLKGRLGFNNPDAYGTTVSLRTESLRIPPTDEGDTGWKDVLYMARTHNILDDQDVRRYCMQVDTGNGLPIPGIVLTFSTTIADGYNLFGQQLMAGDHAFSPSSFATKIFGVGVALEGYRGMDDPTATTGYNTNSPADPGSWFLDPLALSATPYIYLIPVGVDSMRTPPLGDASDIRTWAVDDLAIPMPFNIGASGFSTKPFWLASDSLTEPLFSIRKHQSFRPVSTASLFSRDLYGPTGTLLRSQYTNNRLVGRSVWNSQWKLVIPGTALLNDPNEGLDRFLQTVRDIKLHFVTYSYSGN